ncbi:MAG TPA: ATP-dependent DNA helicase [Acidimicrobiales bacterium]|jgi:ATP-dependent DNA helicase DinG|nr:ATP-dependent DNA helicase [Acidimicrobiales bacterium]
MTDEDLEYFAEPDGLDDLDVFGSSGGSEAEAREAGDDGVQGLDKITAQMSDGEHRPEQQEMCRAVAEAMVTRTHLVVQAGTGTGKSLAYLVPAALSGKKVVVATATKALQDQLAEKDLPQVEAGLGLPAPLDYAVLKGRSNYVCLQRVAEVGSGGIQAELGDQGGRADEPAQAEEADGAGRESEAASPPEGMVEEVRQLVAWSQKSQTGDRADLSFEPSDRAWNMVSVGPRECPGAYNCPSGGRCFAEAARERASVADVVVVNTHLYGAHLASGSVVLPEHDVVIFDEAHELEEVMTSSLGVEVTPGRFRSLVTSARSLVEPRDADLLDSLASVGDQIGTLLGDRVGTRVLHDEARPPVDDRELAELLSRGAEVSRRVTDALRRGGAQRSFLPEDGASDADPDRASRKTRTLQAAVHLAEDLHRFETRGDGEVAWVDGTRRNVRLRLSPIDVGPVLSTMLWGEVTSVLTSATIPPRIVERVGLQTFPTEELNVGSPFDYRSHALLYVARHLPDRRTAGAEEALHEELSQLLEAAGGRTLALFTSKRATEAAAGALAPELPYTVLLQGDLPKNLLLERFATDETSCLFATMGFWQGVDIPGRALSLVTIDKLPFPRPDDPLLQARRDRAGSGAFSLVDLPRAATLLAQGAGRLIRNAEDRGVVAVLDPRLATASYRGVLLATLPPMRRSVDMHEVESFLRRALEGDGEGE